MDEKKAQAPPTPPSLPPLALTSNPTGFALKLASAPEDWESQYLDSLSKSKARPTRDPFKPSSGWYFLYGTLRDPAMLAEILHLPERPVLRRAYVVGYTRKRWGQYPALIDRPCGSTVRGSAFHVSDEAAAARLAFYETDNYRNAPCNIQFSDGASPSIIEGFTFEYCGDPRDLSEGDFDLNTWLRQMGRQPVDDDW